MDGIFDLFHGGHVDALEKCRALAGKNGKVIIGIISDKDAENYKRIPIIKEFERKRIILTSQFVDEVILPAPLIVGREFIQKHNIDLVVHGFADENDFEKQKKFFKDPIDMGKFQYIMYSSTNSTTDIINKIKMN